MRIAVCSPDMDERYALSKLAETELLRRGVLPEMALFSMPQELLEATFKDTPLDAALIQGADGKEALAAICRRIPVILAGGRESGIVAFDVGAKYFIEAPASLENMEKALTRCLGGKKEEEAI